MTDPPPDGADAQITRLVEPGQRGTVLSRWNLAAATALALVPLYVFLGVMAGTAVIAMYAGPALGRFAVVPTAVGWVVALVLMILYLARYIDYLPGSYFHRRSLRAVRGRADAVVDPDDPEAMYVQVIPRKNWGRQMLENASDVGFLRIDRDDGVLLFEGDIERWVVPAAAIASVGVEEFKVPPINVGGLDVYPVLVLKVRAGGAVREVTFCHRHGTFRRSLLSDRRRDAAELRREIERLVGNADPV